MNTTNLILWLITTVSSTAFLWWAWKKYGVQRSISALIRVLKGALEISSYTWFMLAISVPMYALSDHWTGKIGSLCIAIAGIATSVPKSKNPIQAFLHNYGSMFGIGLGMAQVFYWSPWYLFFIVPWLLFTGYCMLAEWLHKDENDLILLRKISHHGLQYKAWGRLHNFILWVYEHPIENHTTWIEFSAMLIIFPVYFIQQVL